MRRTRLSLLTVLFAVPALGQTDGTYLLVSSNTVTPVTPLTTIEFWAAWVDPGALFAFWGGNNDLTAGDGVFSNPVNMFPGFGTTTGVIAGNVISGAALGQANRCTSSGCPVSDNPILLATYDWTATDFTPRAVGLFTSNTSHFVVAHQSFGNLIQLYPQEFTPGSGVINVVPAPAAWPLAVLLLVSPGRRRGR